MFVASLGLLMTDTVRLDHVEIFAEPHKGTRGGPSDRGTGQPAPGAAGPLVELGHVIRAGMITYPGLPGPAIAPHLTREASRDRYAAGDRVRDRPAHPGRQHRDLPGRALPPLPRRRRPQLGSAGPDRRPARHGRPGGGHRSGVRSTSARWRRSTSAGGRCCCTRATTSGSARRPTPRGAHFLTRAGAAWLAANGAALVGIDAINIDDIDDGSRPAHTLLLAAGIPVVEHLTGLGQLPPTGARFTAVPLRIEGFGTIPVRAFARLPSSAARLSCPAAASGGGDRRLLCSGCFGVPFRRAGRHRVLERGRYRTRTAHADARTSARCCGQSGPWDAWFRAAETRPRRTPTSTISNSAWQRERVTAVAATASSATSRPLRVM